MDTNKIKRFATEARNILKTGIAAKIMTLGFDRKGNVAEEHRPQLMQGGTLWNGQFYTEGFYHQWMSLFNRVQQKGINEVYEEAAYTWFNRLCAIRILQKNNLCSPVLQYADAARTPVIVDQARQGHLPLMKEDLRQRVIELLDDDTKVTEQFALLITAWCHDNPIINQCFGSMADYTELLLPNNILTEGGFVDMLNHTEFVTDEDFQSPELIGWLYQFYISERKDEVFAKKGKFEADEIPAATQIFTPNWIVKYMVQNTVGRIYLDNNPYETALQKKWQYLVEPSEKTPAENILRYEELTDLKVADLACGSGHILNECFDLLYDLYIAEGYGRGEAIENIFQHNLTGVDIDNRAKQLATFALLLKACQKDASFADAHCLPHVLAMPKPWDEEKNGLVREFLPHFFLGQENQIHVNELIACFDLMQHADSLGSIMKFELSDSTRLLVKQTVEYWHNQDFIPEAIRAQLPAFELILALTEKYHALVMNPPYMGGGNMNEVLSKYVKEAYKDSKGDLATVFVEMMGQRSSIYGRYAFIIPPSWMFLSNFESLRRNIIENQTIDSLLHLSRGVFGADFGASSAVISNTKDPEACGTYFRLVERTFQEFDQKHLKLLFEKTLANPDFRYYFKGYTKDVEDIVYSENGAKIYYPNVSQSNFEKIPGCPIGYWASANIIKIYTSNLALSAVCSPTQGLATADNARFLRLWFEVSRSRIGFGFENAASAAQSGLKWFPCNKGGGFRKWYGNQDYIINWENDGYEIKNFYDEKGKQRSVIRNPKYYYLEAISWSSVSSNIGIAFRYYPKGFIFDHAACNIYTRNIVETLGYVNTKLISIFSNIINPTINLFSGSVGNIPYLPISNIDKVVKQNIYISKSDWNSHESSWDFETNPLLTINENTHINKKIEQQNNEIGEYIYIDLATPKPDSLKWLVEQYKKKWEQMFSQLHENEEELNRQFIEIYGLQDELTPDVPIDEITILQQGEISFVPSEEGEDVPKVMKWNDDVIIKQLISYAVGCMMGRYRLDKPGLHIAHPEPTEEEIAPYSYHGRKYDIDDDGILPLMNSDCGFSDNAPLRMADFVRIAFGEETQVENLNYMEQCLGKTLEQYFVKDFWKDHKKMYQNRPIYWLFASKKGTFQVIAYMHRMNAYTVERIRAKYLLPFIEHLEQEIKKLDMRRAELTTKESKQLQTLQKQLDECREYHERLQVVAEQAISFDLDDGVVVNYAKFGDILAKLK
ncbi:MAG TPA: BREX-1 system adenine-specific DNA-methyltransferase PglX [Bacteroides mediterraneensis]|uniref:BREX-1 system adenine-specific DNA-methyltransferase PglX n=1 Tax=Bacteroides mediterraneensis TaxID=1841856 RepID=UPI002625866A|nr:BREX-1 system adenine-specific DNA-methyltransferase PglX [Bacteroides mediterraneensis]HJH64428.1 BREX-1 system adenine-specific DNA-methyltransferase PglX [Bacteroides mediterraneensis]